jgi:hypothetical protein
LGIAYRIARFQATGRDAEPLLVAAFAAAEEVAPHAFATQETGRHRENKNQMPTVKVHGTISPFSGCFF